MKPRPPHDSAAGQPPPAAMPLQVFHDGGCPLCRSEIDFYRRRPGAERIEWLDVSVGASEEVAPGLSRSAALRRFHVRLPDGRLASGASAFAALWCELPGFRWLGRLARLPGIAPLAEAAYRGFLLARPALQRLARRDRSCAVNAARPRRAARAPHADDAAEAARAPRGG